MIVVELYKGQGLGNQLWVYAAGRSIAEYLNVPFVLMGVDQFKGAGFLEIETAIGLSEEETADVIQRRSWQEFRERNYYDDDLSYVSSGFDERVASLSGAYKLEGLFQSEKYFFGDLEKPKRYFPLAPEVKSKHGVSGSTCVINLRGGEYKRHKNFILPLGYWKAAINNVKSTCNVDKFLVVTDDVPYAKAMFPEFDVLQGGIAECYATLHNASVLIVSNSTFSYFPVKTGGSAKLVIAPMHFARYGNVHKRWASLANLYEGWSWQDTDGKLSSYEQCLSDLNATQSYYDSAYYLCSRGLPMTKFSLTSLAPAWTKPAVKAILSRVFPKKIG